MNILNERSRGKKSIVGLLFTCYIELDFSAFFGFFIAAVFYVVSKVRS